MNQLNDILDQDLDPRETREWTEALHGVIRADGTYGEEGYVYQRYTPIPSFEGNFVTIGSWIIGDSPAGIGLREDATEITMNTSRFIPHYFD